MLQLRKIIFNLVACVVGDSLYLEGINDTEKMIKEHISFTTKNYLKKLSFLPRPKNENMTFLSVFYNTGEMAKNIISVMESLMDNSFDKFHNPFLDLFDIFYLYPMEWKEKNFLCFQNNNAVSAVGFGMKPINFLEI